MTDEQREELKRLDVVTQEATTYLLAAGFTLSDDQGWTAPTPDHRLSDDETDAVNWLWHHANPGAPVSAE